MGKKAEYERAVVGVQFIFDMLEGPCVTFASFLKIRIGGEVPARVGFDMTKSVNRNFDLIDKKLKECDERAVVQLQQLEDNFSSDDFTTERSAAEALAATWLTTGSCRDVCLPAHDGAANANRIRATNQALTCVAFRKFYDLVRNDVRRLAELRFETYVKEFRSWEVPVAEHVEIVLRAKSTVSDVHETVGSKSRRFKNLFSVSDVPGWRSLPLEGKAKALEELSR